MLYFAYRQIPICNSDLRNWFYNTEWWENAYYGKNIYFSAFLMYRLSFWLYFLQNRNSLAVVIATCLVLFKSSLASRAYCNSQTLSPNDDDISRVSWCPWNITRTCDTNRVPRRMNNATCLSANFPKIACRPVMQHLPVKRFINGSWKSALEMFNMACVPVMTCW